MTPEAIHLLYDYTYWASERVWGCIMQLTDEQFTRDLDYSMGSIRNQVVHLMSGTRRWMERLQGIAISPHLLFEEYSTRAAAKTQWDAMKVEVLDYIYSLDQARLDAIVHLEIPSRNVSVDRRRWPLLLHIANHATDHRAQILSLLHHHFGVKTVEQDMFFYLVERE